MHIIWFVDMDQANVLKWVNGNTVSSNYTNWSPHFPKNHPNQTDCGKVEAGNATACLYVWTFKTIIIKT